jgi:putative endonuclease
MYFGKGSSYSRSRNPVKLSHHEICRTEEEAIRREKQIKKWSRAKKLALIKGDIEELKRLAKKNT